MEPATDLAILVKKGYSEKEARLALETAQGDLKQAALILRDGSNRDTSWLQNTANEWVDNVPQTSLPTNAESRALWKSPIYVRVGSWTRRDNNNNLSDRVYYVLTVIMRDARQWTLKRSFSDFFSLYSSFPYGKMNDFTNTFPAVSMIHIRQLSDEKVEQRRIRLEEWLRELCLNERCMTDPLFINPLYEFLEEAKHPPVVTDIPLTKSPFNEFIGDSLPTAHTSLKFLTSFPISFPAITKNLPCKVRLYSIFSGDTRSLISACHTGKDSSDIQLNKDIERDKVVINGKRFLGSNGGLKAVLNSAKETVRSVQTHGNVMVSTDERLELFCKTAFQRATRTESAFLSHTMLSLLIDMTIDPDILVVPESSLAQALELDFFLTNDNEKERLKYLRGSDIVIPSTLTSSKSHKISGTTLACEIRAATVYRIFNSLTMETLFQIKVTYCIKITERHSVDNQPNSTLTSTVTTDTKTSSTPPDPYEDAYFILEKETLTTSRDWKGDQTF
mmetsp:Transcript_35547/g.36226  ORF Transcript_35547/g.36226 Transcript_35547/m.36226 type:complete len:504 (+) Transcript_35547:302-1813(+)